MGNKLPASSVPLSSSQLLRARLIAFLFFSLGTGIIAYSLRSPRWNDFSLGEKLSLPFLPLLVGASFVVIGTVTWPRK